MHADNLRLARRLSRGATTAVLADSVVTITRPLADLLDPAAGRATPVSSPTRVPALVG